MSGLTRVFVELPSFRSDWKALGLTDTDLRRLQEELLANPKIGSAMQGTGGVRKMRFAFENRGKSGAERNELKKLVEILEGELDRKP